MSAYDAPNFFARSSANAAKLLRFSGDSSAASTRDTRSSPGKRPRVAQAAAPAPQVLRNSRRERSIAAPPAPAPLYRVASGSPAISKPGGDSSRSNEKSLPDPRARQRLFTTGSSRYGKGEGI